MSVPLATFFAEMAPFLRGERAAAAVLDTLGPSPSGQERFALYAELVRRQRRGIIDHFYRTVAAAAGSDFAALRDDYLAAFPPTHWSPNEAARAFPRFLEERVGLSPSLVELADYAWLRHAVMHEDHDETIGLDRSLFVRHYDHDVVSFVREASDGTSAAALPAVAPTTVVITRHRRDGHLVVGTPSLAALYALAAADATPPSVVVTLPADLSWPVVITEAARLEQQGWVPEGTAEHLAARARGAR